MERRKCWEELEEMIWIRKQAMGAMGGLGASKQASNGSNGSKQAMGAMGALGEDDMDRQASIMEASKQWE